LHKTEKIDEPESMFIAPRGWRSLLLPAGFGLNTPVRRTLSGLRIAPDLHTPWWPAINLLHRAVARTERGLDDGEQVQCSLT
jgi:hypothetical protein